MQAKLLRVLQEHEFERVGGTTTLRADVRVIAATNRDLEQAVDAGAFRADLYYRLNVFAVKLPPLRERGDDVRMLAERFGGEMAPSMGKETVDFTADALAALAAHPWRGNIRELRNAVERALIVCDGEMIAARDLGLSPLPRARRRIAPMPRPRSPRTRAPSPTGARADRGGPRQGGGKEGARRPVPRPHPLAALHAAQAPRDRGKAGDLKRERGGRDATPFVVARPASKHLGRPT